MTSVVILVLPPPCTSNPALYLLYLSCACVRVPLSMRSGTLAKGFQPSSLLFCGHPSREEKASGSRCRHRLLIRAQNPSGAGRSCARGSSGAPLGIVPAPVPCRAAGSHSRATMQAQRAPLGTKPNLRDTGAEKALPKKDAVKSSWMACVRGHPICPPAV